MFVHMGKQTYKSFREGLRAEVREWCSREYQRIFKVAYRGKYRRADCERLFNDFARGTTLIEELHGVSEDIARYLDDENAGHWRRLPTQFRDLDLPPIHPRDVLCELHEYLVSRSKEWMRYPTVGSPRAFLVDYLLGELVEGVPLDARGRTRTNEVRPVSAREIALQTLLAGFFPEEARIDRTAKVADIMRLETNT